MGATPLFPLFIALFCLWLLAEGKTYAEISQDITQSASAALQAGTFLTYRQVVTAYLIARPGAVGTVPTAHLSGQGISNQVQAQIGHLTVPSAAGRQLIVFTEQANGLEVFRQAENDAAIGRVKNGQFEPYLIGGMASALPVALPEGYVVSFVEIGN